MGSETPVATLPRRDLILIPSCIALITLLAWAYLVNLARQMPSAMNGGAAMAGMHMTMDVRLSVRDLFFTFAMWSVMMVGMMSPSAAPVILLFAKLGPQGRQHNGARVLLFGLGYVVVWLGFSAAAALAQSALHAAGHLSSNMSLSSPFIASAILIGAGVYQLTPPKKACLTQCQSPLGFLMTKWREGPSGAFKMGTGHGIYCLGCCWALMCVLFAVGAMNLAWVALLTAFVLVEKVGRKGVMLSRSGGLVMIALGIAMLAS